MKNLFLFLLFLLPVFFCNAAERGVSEKSTGKNLVKMQKNALFLHFFSKIFGHIKKKQYLCTRFRKGSTTYGHGAIV